MWFLALRQLLARKRQTAFVIGGILLGTAAYVAISGMMLGFQIYMTERLIDNTGHFHISAREQDIGPRSLDEAFFGGDTLVTWAKPPSGRRDHQRIGNPAGWFAVLDGDPRVLGYSQQLTVQAFARRGGVTTAVRVVGVDPFRHERVTTINDFMLKGHRLSEIGRSGNRVAVGTRLLAKLGGSVGETIALSTASGTPFAFRVVAAFEFGNRGVDDGTIYASLADAQKLNRTPSQITDIVVRIADVSQARDLATSLALLSPDKVESWDQENEGILSVFNMQTIVRNLMSFCILLVAGFGIYNVLNMIVNQKRREIGILRSMGYMSGEIRDLFLYQGLVFGGVGGFLGLLVGNLACHYIETLHIGSPGTTSFRNVTVTYDWPIYAKAFSLALGASLLAGWIPARSAARLEPIDIIRSEGG